MRKLQILSDLHLELRREMPLIRKVGDDLALLGNKDQTMYVIYNK